MAQKGDAGWIYTSKVDHIQEFYRSNILPKYQLGNERRFPAPIRDLPRIASGKQWTDESLLSAENIGSYLSKSDEFHRTRFASIVDKWKQHDRNKTNELISSFDDRYNMKVRFQKNQQLNRSSENKYGSTATYFRFLGDEKTRKNSNHCTRHQYRTREYEQRHLDELLKFPANIENGSRARRYSKRSKLPPIGSSSTFRSSTSVVENSQNSFSSVG